MTTPPATPEKMTLDRSDGSATIDLYRAALGPVRVDYYLKTFTRFDAAGTSVPSWNWAAALLSLNWMLFRKLWTTALAYVGALLAATLLLFGIGRLVFQLSPETQWLLLALVILLAVVLPGVYGNAWLYAYCNKKMERALAASATLEEACASLSRDAGGIKRMVSLAGINVSLCLLTTAIVLSWPHPGTLPVPVGKVAQAHVEGLVQSAPPKQAISPPAAAAPALPDPAAVASAPEKAALIASVPAVTEQQASAKEPVKTVAAHQAEKTAPTTKTAKATQLTKAERRAKAKAEKRETAEKAATKAAEKSLANNGAATINAPESGKFLINVGLFADDNNARNAFVKLQDAGLPALSQEIKSSKGKRTRVRVGPFETQAEADRAAERIRALQLDAAVFKQ